MAKISNELYEDLRKEDKNYKKNGGSGESVSNPGVNSKTETKTETNAETKKESETEDKKTSENSGSSDAGGSANSGPSFTPPIEEKDEFKEKFDAYFKGAGSIVTGSAIVGIVDDLKANLLLIYAKKKGVDLPKDAFKLDKNSAELCGFLVDYAVKNSLFDWVKKHPIISAAGVVGISALTSYVFIEALGKGEKEKEDLKKRNEDLEALLSKMAEEKKTAAHKNSTVTEPIG